MRLKITLIVFGIVVLLYLIIGYGFFAPALLHLSEYKIKSIGTIAMSNAVAQTVKECDFDDLVTIYTGTTGEVTCVKMNTAEINRIASLAAQYAGLEINRDFAQGVSVRAGSALGTMLTGLGPEINIAVQPKGNVTTEYFSSFMSAGINQTRHRIYLTLHAEVTAVIGLSHETYTLQETMIVCENIIVGATPNSFVDVNNEEDMLNLIPEM